MGAGFIAAAVAAGLIVWNIECVKRVVQEQIRLHRFVNEERAAAAEDAAVAELNGDGEPSPPKYESLSDLHEREQRRVRFATTLVEYDSPPLEFQAPLSTWRSAFYRPNRQRFETIIVDGVYLRHGFSSSSHSIEGL